MESFSYQEDILEKEFEVAFTRMQRTDSREFTELREDISKVDFLKWLVEKKKVLLHGSNNQNILDLEPRLANCLSKEFGNMEAVYAVEDPIVPTFFAIRDRHRFTGRAESGFSDLMSDGAQVREYHFAINGEMLAQKPWSTGAIYILPRHTFMQGHDDEGNPIDEWASRTHVKPLGKIKVSPHDFPHLQNVKAL